MVLGVVALFCGSGAAVGGEPPPPRPSPHTRSELPFVEDTPDQALAPDRALMRRQQGAVRPGDPGDPFPKYAKYRDLEELETVPEADKGKHEPYCTKAGGPYQKEMERHLKLRPADGRQSPADCAAIQEFQRKHDIAPRTGYAGPHTWGTARLARARSRPDQGGRCPVRAGRRVACVDLSRQLMWVQRGRKVVFGPALIRSGKPGYETRTGMFSVDWRSEEHTSTLYDAPMPFAQFFSGGQAFHGRYRTIHYEPGSHGCVNLRYRDAERLWKTLRTGDAVFVYGRKPPARP
ncbi:L,D-transpeptidase family protein [Streptomyces sp. YC537]|uniref:L,D-transpeptidase family protein n=1 Tax=Streptomyces boluensis TaxID=1775135 RepID=A0A964XL11_9ACTN|nr:L,D-transpeptidase family protein [Streptomyces boluensis]